VQVVYYRSSGAPLIKQLSLAANTSMTLNLTSDVGPNQFVGAASYATLPVVVEQTMFYNVQGASGGYACIVYGQG
jgi:hypothetical protein